jgi:hypothetical protein
MQSTGDWSWGAREVETVGQPRYQAYNNIKGLISNRRIYLLG